MGGSSTVAAELANPDVFPWLKTLPLAPEYHPTIQEFQDPIAYIFKIEKEASKYGICKIVPPLPPQSKKSVISNFNKSLSAQNPNSPPTFTTRLQQIGFCPRKQRPTQKSVWQSGEHYTLQQFETKAKNFEKKYLKNRTKKTVSSLEVETLYWKANGDRPFSVEYANDMPGSGFVPMKGKKTGEIVSGGAVNVGDSAWNMRGVARANGSLLRFMKEEIPGVTSPMLYVAMMFSWFAWHVEDHDLHSLNYLHVGSGKTWYGVPRDAAAAFEEVIRVHAFGEEINPLVTFATLGEKTTVMSPEVLINAGVPCCRLVQNSGEFVVTFPRAYHSGFSHGFNCGEASNIATPEWLRFAKEAAIRRASINYPAMVSHFQLLYDLALAICSRVPMASSAELRSSRLKNKKGEGEMLVKQMFVQDVMQNNELLYTLGQGSEVVLLPHNSSEKFVWSNLRVGSKYKVKPGLPFSLYSSEDAIKASDDIMLARDVKQLKTSYSIEGKSTPVHQDNRSQANSDSMCTSHDESQHSDTEKGHVAGDGLSDRGLFSCVKCGIWTFACVAIMKPTDSAAHCLMSTDNSIFNDWVAGSGVSSQGIDATDGVANHSVLDTFSGLVQKNAAGGLYNVPFHSSDYQVRSVDNTPSMKSTPAKTIKESSYNENKESSALGLLAMTYGNSSDSDEDDELPNHPAVSEDNISVDGSSGARFNDDDSASSMSQQGYDSSLERGRSLISSRSECEAEDSPSKPNFYGHHMHRMANSDDSECETDYFSGKFTDDNMNSYHVYSPTVRELATGNRSNAINPVAEPDLPFVHRCDEESSRMHVFCLEHAVEVEKLLRPVGGVHILLVCHPDFPKVQTEAKKVAEELEMEYVWKDIAFSEASQEDEEHIQLALQSEEATPKNGDWAVKLGINLFYSAILSRSPLYNKQMPYNSVIYSAFGSNSPSKSASVAKVRGKAVGRQKKLVAAGKWCGRVWMSNQVHPLLVPQDLVNEERAISACLKPDENLGRKPEIGKKTETTPIYRKVGRKRKSAPSKAVKKKEFEAQESVDTDPKDSVDGKPEFELRRSIRMSKTQYRSIKRVKHQEETIPESYSEDDLPNVKTHRGPWRSGRALKTTGKPIRKKRGRPRATMHDGYSDDSLDHKYEGRINETTIKAVGKRTRKLKEQQEEMMDTASECSPDDDSEEEPARNISRSPQLEPRTPQWQISKQFEPVTDDEMEIGKSTRHRKRSVRLPQDFEIKSTIKRKNLKGSKTQPTKNSPTRKGPKMRFPVPKAQTMKGPTRKAPPIVNDDDDDDDDDDKRDNEFCCDIEGCAMSFGSKQELAVHKRNICPVKGCGKKFFSHKYLIHHRRVHVDDRPLKCPWKGCRMTFKWAWARTEHIRVHTGARPYICNEPDCGQTFRFVSDFSRHKRKTGHSVKKVKK